MTTGRVIRSFDQVQPKSWATITPEAQNTGAGGRGAISL